MTQWFLLIKCPSPDCEWPECFSPVLTVSFMCQVCSGIILGPLRGESLVLLICSDVRVKERYHLQNSRAASNARFVSQWQEGPSWRRAVWRSTWGVVFILFEDFWFQVSHVFFFNFSEWLISHSWCFLLFKGPIRYPLSDLYFHPSQAGLHELQFMQTR